MLSFSGKKWIWSADGSGRGWWWCWWMFCLKCRFVNAFRVVACRLEFWPRHVVLWCAIVSLCLFVTVRRYCCRTVTLTPATANISDCWDESSEQSKTKLIKRPDNILWGHSKKQQTNKHSKPTKNLENHLRKWWWWCLCQFCFCVVWVCNSRNYVRHSFLPS